MRIGVHDDQFQAASRQPSQTSDGYYKFNDSSGPFFSMYSEIAEGEDNKMLKHWQKDSEGILIFVRTNTTTPCFTLIH